MTRKRLGKVITPLKTIYARLPLSFSLWLNKIQILERKLPLPEDLILLIRIYVAQLNTCHFCIDIGHAIAIMEFKQQEKFFQVQDFETSPLFEEKDRAALRFARELTLNKKVTDDTFHLVRKYFSEKEVIGITWAVASEHVYNLMNLAFEIGSDGLCTLSKKPSNKLQSQVAS